jgi:hypothetical protein
MPRSVEMIGKKAIIDGMLREIWAVIKIIALWRE